MYCVVERASVRNIQSEEQVLGGGGREGGEGERGGEREREGGRELSLIHI